MLSNHRRGENLKHVLFGFLRHSLTVLVEKPPVATLLRISRNALQRGIWNLLRSRKALQLVDDAMLAPVVDVQFGDSFVTVLGDRDLRSSESAALWPSP